jgi:hypothetical protein
MSGEVAMQAIVVTAALAAVGISGPSAVPIPGGTGGVGFDDLLFAPGLHRVLVPAGRTGNLDLIDPATREVTAIAGFSTAERAEGHSQGTTSACEGRGLLFASDRNEQKLVVVDPQKRGIVASVKLAAKPDYVRWSEPTSEVWVTEPAAKQIEVFSIPAKGTPTPTPTLAATIRVEGGPESLVIDARRGRAYTHLWKLSTVAVDLRARSITATWKNGCEESRGIALDEERGLLFAGCDEGKATAMDLQQAGRVVSTLATGKGVDVIAFAPKLRHLYVPGEDSGTMVIAGVAKNGKLSELATVPTAKGAHCVTEDDRGGVWVCDPQAGQLLHFQDALPTTGD